MKYFLDYQEVTIDELKKALEEETGETEKGRYRTIKYVELVDVDEEGLHFFVNDFTYDNFS